METRGSIDSAHAPLSNYQNSPYPPDTYHNESGYMTPAIKKKGLSPWVKIGVPVLLLVIAGAVVGGVIGSRSHNKNVSTASSSGGNSNPAAASSAVSAKNAIGIFPTSTDSYELPVYPSTVSPLAIQEWLGLIIWTFIDQYRCFYYPNLSRQ